MTDRDLRFVLSAQDKSAAAFKALQKNIGGVKASLEGLSGAVEAVAGIAGVAAITELAHSAIEAADQINVLAQKTQLSVETIGELKFAAGQADTDFDSLVTGVKKLSTALLDVQTGNKDQQKLFKALGVSALDASGQLRNPVDVLQDLAGVFSTIENPALKSALAVKLFGKSGTDLLPFLSQGASGIAELRQQAHDLGAVLTKETVAALDEAGDNFKKLQAAITNLSASTLSSAAKGFNDFAQSIIDAKNKSKDGFDFFGQAIHNILNPQDIGSNQLDQSISQVSKTITDLQNRLDNLRQGSARGGRFGFATDVSKEIDNTKAALQASTKNLQRLLDERNSTLTKGETKTAADLSSLVSSTTQALVDQFNKQADAFKSANDKLKDAVQRRVDLAKSFKDLRTEINAPSAGLSAGTIVQPIDTIAKGKEALKKGDAEAAIKLAEQARDQLSKLNETGGASKTLLNDLSKQAAEVADQGAAKQEDKLRTQIDQIKTQLEALAAAGNVKVTLGTADVPGAIQRAASELQAEADKYKITFEAVAQAKGNSVPGTSAPGFAAGGAVRGIGGPRSDSVLAWLSPGEHVLTAADVARAGGHDAIYRLRRMLAAQIAPRFADGGAVAARTSIQPVNHFKFTLPDGSSISTTDSPADIRATLRRAALKVGTRR